MSAFVRAATRLDIKEVAFSVALIGAAVTVVAASISTLII
jgi:hypothetical protein